MPDKRSALHHMGTFVPYLLRSFFQTKHSPHLYSLSRHLSGFKMHLEDAECVKRYRTFWAGNKDSFKADHPYQRVEKDYRLTEIARNDGKSEHYGKLLYALVDFYKPKRLLETGTSLGISTLYQALAMDHDAQLTTIEGVEGLHQRASKAFQGICTKQVDFMLGKIDDCLSQLMNKDLEVDWVFLDGDHRYESTLAAVHSLLPAMSDGGVILLDDIRWSDGMWHAWKECSSLPCVSHAVDFHMLGLLVFKKQSQKQFYTLYW
jgi:predicted O-methyltransferase YrrM